MVAWNEEGPIPNVRSYAGACACLLALAMGACGGDDATSSGPNPDAGGSAGATQRAGSSGPGAEATASCIDACNHQIGRGCPGTTEMYRPWCENACARTTELISPDCLDELLAMRRCQAALTWECDSFGGAQPTSTCAAESGACLQCMDGTLCDSAALELGR